MPRYVLWDLDTGDPLVLEAEAVERLLGIELGYLDWTIEQDGLFENGKWRLVRKNACVD